MSYIALVNLFNYQEKIFPPPPPPFSDLRGMELAGFGINRKRLHNWVQARITPGVERANNGPTSGIIYLAHPNASAGRAVYNLHTSRSPCLPSETPSLMDWQYETTSIHSGLLRHPWTRIHVSIKVSMFADGARRMIRPIRSE